MKRAGNITLRPANTAAGKPGEAMLDDLNDQQICADNVIAIGAMHIETTIREDSYNGLPLNRNSDLGRGARITLP